ncbi:MAG: InlB B-repeat-containing protein [Planctomycetota bacterium]|jgi:hypothetical protein
MKRLVYLFAVMPLMLTFISAVAFAHTETNPFITDLIANGGDADSAVVIGDVRVWNDEEYLCVQYFTDSEAFWYMTGTHVHVATYLGGIPQENDNPIPGQFEHKDTYYYEDKVSLSIPLEWYAGTVLYIAAHANVGIPGGLEGLELALPDQVTMSVSHPYTVEAEDLAYFLTMIDENSFLTGAYPGWCIDTDNTISQSTQYTVNVYSSYETLPDSLMEYPENLDLVNWILNQSYVGQLSSSDGTYTFGDVQRAIWALVDDQQSTNGLGPWSQARVDEILADAYTNGEGFEPACDEVVAVILAPQNGHQAIIVQVIPTEIGIPCETVDEDAWGDGEEFSGNEWAAYFNYRVQEPAPWRQYTVTATAGPNGSVSPESVNVNSGDDQQFAANPKDGYVVDTWFLDGEDVKGDGNTYILSKILANHAVHVTFRRILSHPLGDMKFKTDEEFFNRITSNNFSNPYNPQMNRTHIKREVDLDAMVMYNLMDNNPDSPGYGQMVHARAKCSFIGTGVNEVLLYFEYMFRTSKPGVELVVYLSDSPLLFGPDDPLRELHCIEVARIPIPPSFRPGSAERGCFAVFEKVVNTGHLNLSMGTWFEVLLYEPPPPNGGLLFTSSITREATSSEETSVVIDSWSPSVQCYGICLDTNWDNFVNEADFMVVVGESGSTASGDLSCLEGVFSTDGTLDSFDIASWDWAMSSEDRLLNFCGVPLTSEGTTLMSAAVTSFESSGTPIPLANISENLGDLLIVGKRDEMNAASKLKDRLYAFENNGLCDGLFELTSDRCNTRLVKGLNGELYQLNSEKGLLLLDNMSEVIIPPGQINLIDIKEPRYDRSATVYIGIQDEGPDSFGRPILDAVFDEDFVYVVPVVINPVGGEPYTAAAKLRLLDESNPPYEVVELYDDPPLLNDNQYRDYLREIELDSAGNLYVLNVHCYNESDILWRYYPDGVVERLELGRPDSDNYVRAPISMCASRTTSMLYLASAANNPEDSDSTVIYGFSTKDDALTLMRTVTINGMHHVTGITENPQTGSLWVAGFNMYEQLMPLFDPDSHDLALPMSVVWTSAATCGGVDLDQSGDVGFSDLAVLAGYWLDTNCAEPQWCDGADADQSQTVDTVDLAILTQNWLENGCLD